MQIEVKVSEVICDVILHLAALRQDAIVAGSTSAVLDSMCGESFMFCLVC